MARKRSSYKKGQPVNYFKKERCFLKIFGLSLTGDEGIGYKIYSFMLIFSTSFIYPVLEFRELFVHDIEAISDMLIYVFGTYVALAKTIVVLQNRIQIGKMLEHLEQEPFTVNLERGGIQEEKLIRTCLWITDIQTLVYWILSFGTIYLTSAYAVLKGIKGNSNNWDLPYGPLTIFNLTSSFNYNVAFIYQNICLTSIVSHFTTIDLLMAAILAHLSYQFKMLQNCLRRIVTNCYRDMKKDKVITDDSPEMENGSKIPWKYLQKYLKMSIKYHLEITALASNMEQVFNKLLLTIFLGTLGIMCFSIYRTSEVQDNVKVMIYVGDAFSGCLQVLTVCYWGEQVLFESEQVGRAAYEANFMGTDLRFQKSLAFIIRRSQTPTSLTAGKFADTRLTTFAWVIRRFIIKIMRTSYSAFMIVKGNKKNV